MEKSNDVIEQIDKILQSVEPGSVDKELVQLLNKQAVNLMLKGRIDKALEQLFEALHGASDNIELRVQSLINIGDLVRRTALGGPTVAEKIFQQAELLPMSNLTKSRLLAMKAMVYVFKTEAGKPEPEGVQKNIDTLTQAIAVAQQAYGEDKEAALHAESFVLHRQAGTVQNWGTESQKSDILQRINSFVPRLDPESAEVARFNYSKAMIISGEQPKQAIELLIASAERINQEPDRSPADACAYYILAAELSLRIEQRDKARAYWLEANKLESYLKPHTNSQRYLQKLIDLKKELF